MKEVNDDISKKSNARREVRVVFNPSSHDLPTFPSDVQQRLDQRDMIEVERLRDHFKASLHQTLRLLSLIENSSPLATSLPSIIPSETSPTIINNPSIEVFQR